MRLKRIDNVRDNIAVSIHAPARGATLHRIHAPGHVLFQSTHPHGVRRLIGEGSNRLAMFQSTHPHGVRPSPSCVLGASNQFQSTHPHGVRRADDRVAEGGQGVSIHAPARGATQGIFGCDGASLVSIHAPARGATACTINFLILRLAFQSTHPHGVRPSRTASSDIVAPFQSTHPHGVRLTLLSGEAELDYVSIHAPARGATESAWEGLKLSMVSIHAPARGAT